MPEKPEMTESTSCLVFDEIQFNFVFASSSKTILTDADHHAGMHSKRGNRHRRWINSSEHGFCTTYCVQVLVDDMSALNLHCSEKA